jgi:hypothetical protein
MVKIDIKNINENNIKYAALSGVMSGVVMIIFEMFVSLTGKGFWAPIRAVSAALGMGIKDLSTQYDFFVAPVMTGIVIHIMFSMMLGILFFVVLHETLKDYSFITGLAVAAAWGFVLYIVIFIVLLRLPIFSGGRIITDVVPQWAWMLGYIMFGAIGFASLRSMKSLLVVSGKK